MRGRTLLIAGLLTVAYAGQASAQIVGTEHNLSGGAKDNGEVCVYCHTPHGSNTGVDAPLWNKPAVTSTYTSYSSTTIDGAVLAVGSVSVACLTCHDGTQAMDAVVNAPGMGTGDGLGPNGSTLIGAGLAMDAGEIAMLGTDLSNDHPIGVMYGGYDDGSGQIDPDFENAAGNLETDNINGLDVWWVDTEAVPNQNRDKSDMILYTRAGDPYVECASCHDPHNETEDTFQVNFLRMANTGSDLCLACHVK